MTHTIERPGSPPPAPVSDGLPHACGALSSLTLDLLRGNTRGVDPVEVTAALARVADPLEDRDFQLALWLCYELHLDGFAGVDPRLEWDPAVLELRSLLEADFEAALRDLVGAVTFDDPLDELRRRTGSGRPSRLARHLGRDASREEFLDHLAQRALYHLRESDPQSFVLPRLRNSAKVALAELQYDEYGGGVPDRLHSTLYVQALAAVGLPTEVSAYVDKAEAAMLATVNTMSFLCLHRRLRGAAMGHLAAFEATSSLPCRLIALGAHRLELPAEVAAYYEEHVEADAVHEQVAIDAICGGLLREDPTLADDVVFGAAVCLAIDDLMADAQLRRWAS